MDDRKYTAYCGLYCRDCIPGNPRLFELIAALLREFEDTGFAHYAAYKANKIAFLNEFSVAERFLQEVLKLRCSGSRLEGPESELGCMKDCAIRRCVAARNLEGCWQCSLRSICEHIAGLSGFHPGIYRSLDAIARHGIESWTEHRGKYYPWSRECPASEGPVRLSMMMGQFEEERHECRIHERRSESQTSANRHILLVSR
jgi:hypothetical protein